MHTDVMVIGDDWGTVSRASLMLYRRGFTVISAGPDTDPADVTRDCDPRFVVEIRSPDRATDDATGQAITETDGPQTVLYQRVCSYPGTPAERSETFRALSGTLAALADDGAGLDGRFRIGDLELDAKAHLVSVAGRTVELAATPFELLRILMDHADQVLSKAQLLELMYGYDGHSENLIEAHVSTIRRAIDITYPHIETVRGVGYVIRSTPSNHDEPDPTTRRDPRPQPVLELVSAFPISHTNTSTPARIATAAGSPPPPPAAGAPPPPPNRAGQSRSMMIC